MPNPRNAMDWSDLDHKEFTFKADNSTITYDATQPDGSAVVGRAVTVSANGGIIALAGDGTAVLGKLIKVESDLMCTVQVRGMCQLPGGAAATLTRGTGIVGAANSGNGYIRSAASATAAELLVMKGKIIDPTTTTAVWVDLG